MDLFGVTDSRDRVGIITPWSLIHFLAGLNGYILLNRLNINPFYNYIILLDLHTLYEMKDYIISYHSEHADTVWGDNSLINSITDTIFFLLGIIIANKIKHTPLIPLVSIIIYTYIFSNQRYG
jgi:hypothetical protein